MDRHPRICRQEAICSCLWQTSQSLVSLRWQQTLSNTSGWKDHSDIIIWCCWLNWFMMVLFSMEMYLPAISIEKSSAYVKVCCAIIQCLRHGIPVCLGMLPSSRYWIGLESLNDVYHLQDGDKIHLLLRPPTCCYHLLYISYPPSLWHAYEEKWIKKWQRNSTSMLRCPSTNRFVPANLPLGIQTHPLCINTVPKVSTTGDASSDDNARQSNRRMPSDRVCCHGLKRQVWQLLNYNHPPPPLEHPAVLQCFPALPATLQSFENFKILPAVSATVIRCNLPKDTIDTSCHVARPLYMQLNNSWTFLTHPTVPHGHLKYTLNQ